MTESYKSLYYVIIVLLPILLNSCASSSYYERYGSSTSSSKKDEVKVKERKPIIVEDESAVPTIEATEKESETIFNKLSYLVNDNSKKESFLKEIVSFLNTPYRYGGNSRSGIDCSAFTQKMFNNSLKIKIPRTAREQYRTWEVFNDKTKLKFGDLIYFDTSKRYFPGHVGIYLDNNLFAHASSSNGVIISSLTNNYYKKRYIGANRVKIKR